MAPFSRRRACYANGAGAEPGPGRPGRFTPQGSVTRMAQRGEGPMAAAELADPETPLTLTRAGIGRRFAHEFLAPRRRQSPGQRPTESPLPDPVAGPAGHPGGREHG